jgi:predicted HAD superfamily Cof-like phosphohydrolase
MLGSSSNYQKSHSILVKEFTEESRNIPCPSFPSPLNKEEVNFIIRMIKSELWELAVTVSDNNDEALVLISSISDIDTNPNYKKPTSETSLIAEQVDAFVDIYYYSLNALSKKGINMEPVFQEVHKANMNKRFGDGKFHRRDDGKIIKPEEWKEPDIDRVIEKMKREGSW